MTNNIPQERRTIYSWSCHHEDHPKQITSKKMPRLQCLLAADKHADRYPGHTVLHLIDGKVTLDYSYTRPKEEAPLWYD